MKKTEILSGGKSCSPICAAQARTGVQQAIMAAPAIPTYIGLTDA